MRIGRHTITPNLILAPMAGVTDKPFRLLCKRLGAGLAVSEMTTSDPRFWTTSKSLHRMDHVGEPDPVSVQIAGQGAVEMEPAGPYAAGQVVKVTAHPSAGYIFTGWSGAQPEDNNPAALQIAGNVMLTANFAPANNLYLPSIMQAVDTIAAAASCE